MAETVLVTGGSGFIAGWCIVELLRRGYMVRTTVRSLDRADAVRAAIAGEIDPVDRLSFFAADLTSDAGWDAATEGCDYVLHVASPLGTGDTKDPNELIIPARDGALRALRAAEKAGVKRVVLTSSVAAVGGLGTGELTDETNWTDLSKPDVHAYRQSKTLAEQAAWDFVAQHPKLELTTILPCVVIGPVLAPGNLGSVQVISRLVSGSIPGTPPISFNLVDVRDVVDAHIRAMTSPDAAGERFLAVAGSLWMAEIGAVLRTRMGSRATKVPRRNIPGFVVRLLSMFDPALRYVTPMLHKVTRYDNTKARRVLGWSPRPIEDSIADCGESLIAKGAV